MTGPNHLIGGYVFSGLFASILGVNFLTDWKYLAVVFIGALIPDIDHTKSFIGKVFLPISKLINRRYGHRTITHSLVFLISTTAILAAFQGALFPDFHVTLLYSLAVCSHFLFDMMTVQGVPLFYPFKKNPCVIPGDPRRRLRTNNIRHETIAMCVFIVAAISLQPLFKNGFWTSYNTLFGTLKHISSEYNKSSDLLKVNFALHEGSRVDSLEGYVVRSSENDIVVYNESGFSKYPQLGQLVRDVIPTHTGIRFVFEDRVFENLTAFQLNELLTKNKITKLNLVGSELFQIKEAGFTKEAKSYKAQYLNDVVISEIKDDESVVFKKNRTIGKIKLQIAELKSSYDSKMIFYKQSLDMHNMKIASMNSETNLIKKEILITKYSKLKAPTLPISNNGKIAELESKIKELEHQDYLRHQILIEESKDKPLKLSGSYEVLIIDSNTI